MRGITGEQLSKQYGTADALVTALHEVNFEIREGEFVAVMGESGSGKSTLLSVVGALNTPTSGTLTVNGIDVYSLASDDRADFRRQTVGFVFQNFHLIPYLTLTENVMLPLATIKLPRKEKQKRALEALARVGLSGKTGRLPNQISGGEQERVALARAIVNKPPILLADEPTGNLDKKTGGVIMDLLQTLNKEGMTIVMVTHSSDYAHCATRILRIGDGVLISPDESR